MRLSERAANYPETKVERFRQRETARLEKIAAAMPDEKAAELVPTVERLKNAPLSDLALKMAREERRRLKEKNASAKECGGVPLGTILDDARLALLVDQIAEVDVDSERELDHLVALVSEHFVDPSWTNYLYYPHDHGLPDDLTGQAIVSLARAFPACVIAMRVMEVRCEDTRHEVYYADFASNDHVRAFVRKRGPWEFAAGDLVAVALCGTSLPDGTRVAPQFGRYGGNARVLGPTPMPPGTDLTAEYNCRGG